LVWRAFTQATASGQLTKEVTTLLVGDAPKVSAPILVACGAALLFLLQILRSRLETFWPCSKCSEPTTIQVRDLEVSVPVCSRCTEVFLMNRPVDRRVRYLREQAVNRTSFYRRYWSRLMTLVLPGSGHLFAGQPWRGMGILVAFGSCLYFFEFTEGMLQPAWPGEAAAGTLHIGYITIAGLIWLGAVTSTVRMTGGRD